MFLTLLKRAVKSALHQATEEWMLETGLSQDDVAQLRAQRGALAARIEARADAQAALALNVDDKEEVNETSPLALPMPSAARVTSVDGSATNGVHEHDSRAEAGEEPDGDTDANADVGDDADLMAWVHAQREAKVGWDTITQEANARGVNLTKKALGLRYLRWRKKSGHADQAEPVA